MDYAEKMQKCSEYVEALEVERRKIQVFQRELPLCLELVSQAIDACRQQLSSASPPHAAAVGVSHECFHVRQQSECSEQTSSHGPVLEEFIPIKRAASCSSEDVGEEEEDESGEKSGDKSGKKSDWLRSVQLWNQSPDPAPVCEVKKNGGAFRPFNKEKAVVVAEMVDKPASSTTVKSRKEESAKEKESGQTQRKQRRCWSPELHRRFIHALQQLGGPHVATPKQIKELMKVDGLTNDEVKSHLQKYRLHMRRPSATMASTANAQGPQFVVVGGIWVPPPEYAAPAMTPAATTSSGDPPEADNGKREARTPSNGVYAPVATVGTPFARPASRTQNSNQKVQSGSHCEDDNGSHSAHGGARAHSGSPASSSSTHTTATATASPASS
uniref:HTH myb-type domain-containing protein n=1 Tax=Kalanchoe fedtschenkoi TaxID=63787 RepID=A0A7N0T5X7_KALFE